MARVRDAHYYPRLAPTDMRWVLVEATDRILPEVGLDMGALHGRAADASATSTSGSTPGSSPASTASCVLSDGEEFDAETIVWTAGVKANPMLADTDLPLDEKGRVQVQATLQVRRASTTPGPPATAPPCRT